MAQFPPFLGEVIVTNTNEKSHILAHDFFSCISKQDDHSIILKSLLCEGNVGIFQQSTAGLKQLSVYAASSQIFQQALWWGALWT